MTQQYLIFFLVGILLFAAVVVYSLRQQKKTAKRDQSKYIDPLFDEIESSKPVATSAKKNSSEQKSAGRSKVKNAKGSAKQTASSTKTKQSTTKSQTQVSAGVTSSKGGAATTSKTPKQSANVASAGSPQKDKSSTIVTELVARFKNTKPIEQQELLALFRKHDFKFNRKVHIYGLNELTDLWRDIEFELPSARFVSLGVAIQLADRDGAMSQKELHDFQQMVLEFTNTIDVPFEFSLDIDEAQQQALLLDEIGRRYDSMAVLNVVPRAKTGFRMADIESCARDLGMTTDKNGIFFKSKGQRNNIVVNYRLACTDGAGHFGLSDTAMAPIHDLVMYMNVPATDNPEIVFQEMVKDANSLATWLDGKVVDRNGRVMTQRSYSVLTQQISDIAYSMQQDGLVPGDEVSKKIF